MRRMEKHRASHAFPPWYYYDIVENVGGARVGKISIRLGDNAHTYYNGHIGFEVTPERRGRGYAVQATRLVLPVAQAYGLERVYITCAVSNTASRRVIEKLGASFIEIASIPQTCFFWHAEIEDYCIYSLATSG